MTGFWTAVIVAVISGLFSFGGVYYSNRKSSALIDYRLKQVELRLDAHNHFSDRIVMLETFKELQTEKNKQIYNEIDELKGELNHGA